MMAFSLVLTDSDNAERKNEQIKYEMEVSGKGRSTVVSMRSTGCHEICRKEQLSTGTQSH